MFTNQRLNFCLKRKKKKMIKLKYAKLEIQPYFLSKVVHRHQAQLIFKWRTHMYDFKLNFKRMYKEDDLLCKLGCSHIDSQDNILKCDVIKIISPEHLNQSCYENIFGRQVARIKEAATALAAAMEIRNDLLNPIPTDEDDAAQ